MLDSHLRSITLAHYPRKCSPQMLQRHASQRRLMQSTQISVSPDAAPRARVFEREQIRLKRDELERKVVQMHVSEKRR